MSLLSQSLAVSGAKFGEKLMSFGIIIIASRYFESDGVGVFFYYFSLAALLMPLMDLGFEKLLLQRWDGLETAGRETLFGRLIILKVLAGIATLCIILPLDFIVRGAEAQPLAAVAAYWAIYVEGFAFLLRGPQHAKQQVKLELWVPFATRLLSLGALLVLMGRMEHGYQLCLIYAAANTVGAVISLLGLRDCRPRFAGSGPWRALASLAKAGIPFSLTSLFVMVSLSVDSIILGRYDMAATGEYNAAYRVILVVIVLSGGACHALFPRMSQMGAANQQTDAGKLFQRVAVAYLIVFGSIAIGAFVVGPGLMPALYGESFERSGLAFRLLAPLIVLASLTNLIGQTMEALGHQSQVMKLNLVSALFNLVANLILIPRFGIVAAACTTIATEALTFTGMAILLYRRHAVPLLPHGIGRAVLFLAIIALAYMPLPQLNVWLAVVVGGLVFVVLLASFRRFWLAGVLAAPAPPITTG